MRDLILAVVFGPEGRLVAVSSDDMTLRVFEAVTGKEVSRLEVGDRDAVVAVAFSPDGRYVGVASSDTTARVFEAVGDTEAWLLKFQGWFARVGL